MSASSKKSPENANVTEYSAELNAEEDVFEQSDKQFYASIDDEELRKRLQQIETLERMPKRQELDEIVRLYHPTVPIPKVLLDEQNFNSLGGRPTVLHRVKEFCPEDRQKMEALAQQYLDYLPPATKLELLEVIDIAGNKHYAIAGIDAELATSLERMFKVKDLAEKKTGRKDPPPSSQSQTPPEPQMREEGVREEGASESNVRPDNMQEGNKSATVQDKNAPKPATTAPDAQKTAAPPGTRLTDASATRVSPEKPQQAL